MYIFLILFLLNFFKKDSFGMEAMEAMLPPKEELSFALVLKGLYCFDSYKACKRFFNQSRILGNYYVPERLKALKNRIPVDVISNDSFYSLVMKQFVLKKIISLSLFLQSKDESKLSGFFNPNVLKKVAEMSQIQKDKLYEMEYDYLIENFYKNKHSYKDFLNLFGIYLFSPIRFIYFIFNDKSEAIDSIRKALEGFNLDNQGNEELLRSLDILFKKNFEDLEKNIENIKDIENIEKKIECELSGIQEFKNSISEVSSNLLMNDVFESLSKSNNEVQYDSYQSFMKIKTFKKLMPNGDEKLCIKEIKQAYEKIEEVYKKNIKKNKIYFFIEIIFCIIFSCYIPFYINLYFDKKCFKIYQNIKKESGYINFANDNDKKKI